MKRTDQKVLFDNVRQRFKEKCPIDDGMDEERYPPRSATGLKKHFIDISADAQNFRISHNWVLKSNLTGVINDEINSRAVTISLGNKNIMDYNCWSFGKILVKLESTDRAEAALKVVQG